MMEELLESRSRLQQREQEAREFAVSTTPQYRTELMAATESALGACTALLESLRSGPFGAPEAPIEEANSIAEDVTLKCQQLQVCWLSPVLFHLLHTSLVHSQRERRQEA